MSIPRTSQPSKSTRLTLAATGAAAAIAILVGGGVAAAGGGPAPAYRMAADTTQHGAVPAGPAAGWASLPLAAVQASAAVSRKPANRPASHRKPASQPASRHQRTASHGQRTGGRGQPAASLRQAFGDIRSDATRGTARHRSGHHRSGHPRACADSTLHWWICHAEQVLARHGTPPGLLSTDAAYIVVQHESGGNPHAYNGWDINAAQGHPSEGIAQVIGPTFQAYALPGYGNIWDPVDNMIAAFRYAISRYGSMNSIPGVVAVRQGGSYVGY